MLMVTRKMIIIIPQQRFNGLSFEISITIPEHLEHFWLQTETTSALMELFRCLASELVNRPYKDLPDDNITFGNAIIWRPNHDVSHSIRQVVYIHILREMIRRKGASQYTTLEFSEEEWAAIQLASFLFRTGRTNEQSSASGLSQNANSSALFKAIASRLGFNPRLVADISWCIECYAPLSSEAIHDIPFEGYTGTDPNIKKRKAMLTNGLLLLAHNSDLVRCFPNEMDIHPNNRENLGILMENMGQVAEQSDFLLSMARLLCKKTGTAYYSANGSRNKGDLQKKYQSTYRLEAMITHLFDVSSVYLNDPSAEGLFIADRRMMRDYAVSLIQRAFSRKSAYTLEVDNRPKGQSLLLTNEVVDTKWEGIRQYLLNKFPWTLQHVTHEKYIGDLLTSGAIESTKLRRNRTGGFADSNTPDKAGDTGYVFFSIGGKSQPLPDFLDNNSGYVITVPLKNKAYHHGCLQSYWRDLIIEAPPYAYIHGQTFSCLIDDHRFTISYGEGIKHYSLVHPDGTTLTWDVKKGVESVSGKDSIQWLIHYLIGIARQMDEGFQKRLLEDTSHQVLHDFIFKILNTINIETKVPRALSLMMDYIEIKPHLPQAAVNFKNKMQAHLNNRDTEALQELLISGAPINMLIDGKALLTYFLEKSPSGIYDARVIDIITLLVRSGVEIYNLNYLQSPLYILCAIGVRDYLECFLKESHYGQLINKQPEILLLMLKKKHQPIREILVRYGAKYQELSFDKLMFFLNSASEKLALECLDILCDEYLYPFPQGEPALNALSRYNDQSPVLTKRLESLCNITIVKKPKSKPYLIFLKQASQGVLLVKNATDGVSEKSWRLPCSFGVDEGNIADKVFEIAGFRMPKESKVTFQPCTDATLVLIDLPEEKEIVAQRTALTISTKWSVEASVLAQSLQGNTISLENYFDAIKNGRVNEVREWIKLCIYLDVNSRAWVYCLDLTTPDLAMLELLTEYYSVNALVPIKGKLHLPIHLAMLSNRPNMLKALLKGGSVTINPDISLYHEKAGILPPMIFAARHDLIQMLKCLEVAGGDYNNRYNRFALLEAMLGQCGSEMFYHLLDKVDVNATSMKYQFITPAMIAARKNDGEWIDALIKRGADFNSKNPLTEKSARDYMSETNRYKLSQVHEKQDSCPTLTLYLRATGVLSASNFQERLMMEHELSIVSENSDSTLHAFITQLRIRAKVPDRIIIAIANSGIHPVSVCLFSNPAIIVIHKNTLKGQALSFEALVFALACEVALEPYITANPSFSLDINTLHDIDIQILKDLEIGIDVAQQYLSHAATFADTQKDAPYFCWYSPFTIIGSMMSFERMYALRIKMLILQHNRDARMASGMVTTVNAIPPITLPKEYRQYYDVSSVKDPKQWLFDHLPDLVDDFLPYELLIQCNSMKEQLYLKILSFAYQSDKISENDVDDLLKQAVDLKVPCLHALDTFFGDKPRGYFKDYNNLIGKLKPDTTDEVVISICTQALLIQKKMSLWQSNNSSITKMKYTKSLHTDGKIKRQYHYYNIHEKFRLLEDVVPIIVGALQSTRSHSLLQLLWIGQAEMDVFYQYLPEEFVRKTAVTRQPYAKRLCREYNLPIPLGIKSIDYGLKIKERYCEQKAQSIPWARVDSLESLRSTVIQYREVIPQTDAHKSIIDILRTFAEGDGFQRRWFHTIYTDRYFFSTYLAKPRSNYDYYVLMRKHRHHFTTDEQVTLSVQLFNYRNFDIYANNFKNDFLTDDMSADDLLSILNKLDATSSLTHLFKNKTIEFYTARQRSFSPFSTDGIRVFQYLMNKENAHYLKHFFPIINWNLPTPLEISTNTLILLFRYFDGSQAFPSFEYGEKFGMTIIQRIRENPDPIERINLFSLLIGVDVSESLPRLSIETAMQASIDGFCEALIKVMGSDDGSIAYQLGMKKMIDECFHFFLRFDCINIMEKLGKGAESQYPLSQIIRRLIYSEDTKGTNAMAISILAYAELLFRKYLSQDKNREPMLEFLISACSSDDINKVAAYYSTASMEQRSPYGFYSVYYFFWGLSLEQRAALIDILIIPVASEGSKQKKEEDYQKGFTFLCNKFFNNPETDEYYKEAIIAYFDTASEYERQYMFAGFLISTRETEGVSLAASEKFVLFLTHMGAAGIKLGQALDSYPHTPREIKVALRTIKDCAAPPQRIDMWERIKEVLPADVFLQIKRVGKILGSASYHYAVEVAFHDGRECVLLINRKHAGEQANKNYEHFLRTLKRLNFLPLEHKTAIEALLLVSKTMSYNELDSFIGDYQLFMAKNIYTKYQFKGASFHPCANINPGSDYRIVERMHGCTLDKLPEKKQVFVSKIIVHMELINIFSGGVFDCDRHKGQYLFEQEENGNIKINMFDFGEMSFVTPSKADREQIADVLYEFVKLNGTKSLSDIFSEKMVSIKYGEKLPENLIRTQKALLALNDFSAHLPPETLLKNFKRAVAKMHPDYQWAIKKGLVTSHMSSFCFFERVKNTTPAGSKAPKPPA